MDTILADIVDISNTYSMIFVSIPSQNTLANLLDVANLSSDWQMKGGSARTEYPPYLRTSCSIMELGVRLWSG